MGLLVTECIVAFFVCWFLFVRPINIIIDDCHAIKKDICKSYKQEDNSLEIMSSHYIKDKIVKVQNKGMSKIERKKARLREIKYISAWHVFYIKYLKSLGGILSSNVVCYDEGNLKEIIVMNAMRRMKEERHLHQYLNITSKVFSNQSNPDDDFNPELLRHRKQLKDQYEELYYNPEI